MTDQCRGVPQNGRMTAFSAPLGGARHCLPCRAGKTVMWPVRRRETMEYSAGIDNHAVLPFRHLLCRLWPLYFLSAAVFLFSCRVSLPLPCPFCRACPFYGRIPSRCCVPAATAYRSRFYSCFSLLFFFLCCSLPAPSLTAAEICAVWGCFDDTRRYKTGCVAGGAETREKSCGG